MSSISPLNRRVPKIGFTFILSSCPDYHLWMTKFELGGFSIGYVQFITSEPTDSQVSLLLTVMSSSSPLMNTKKLKTFQIKHKDLIQRNQMVVAQVNGRRWYLRNLLGTKCPSVSNMRMASIDLQVTSKRRAIHTSLIAFGSSNSCSIIWSLNPIEIDEVELTPDTN